MHESEAMYLTRTHMHCAGSAQLYSCKLFTVLAFGTCIIVVSSNALWFVLHIGSVNKTKRQLESFDNRLT